MEPHVIREGCGVMKALGREALREKWNSAAGTIFIGGLLMAVPFLLLMFFVFYLVVTGGHGDSSVISAISFCLMYLAVFVIIGPICLGFSSYFLKLFRRQDAGIRDMFSGFRLFGKAAGLFLLSNLMIALWSLLFYIPGYIAYYRYSQAFFLLADNPQLGVLESISESKRMMMGNKGTLFVLDLSFLGWYLLCFVPFLMEPFVLSYFEPDTLGANVSLLIFLVVGTIASITGMFFLAVYYAATRVAAYELMNGNLRPADPWVAENAPAEQSPLLDDADLTEKESEKIE